MSDGGPRPTSTEWQRHGRPSPGEAGEAGEASRTKDAVRPLIPGPPARGRGGDRRMAGERKRRILVVEDEALIAMDLERIVRCAGCEVVGPVGRAEEALRLVAEERLDAAILDIELSEGNSFAVADAFARRRVPFVFVTGSAPAALPERFRGRPLIQKPYDAAKRAAMLGGKAAAARGRGGRPS